MTEINTDVQIRALQTVIYAFGEVVQKHNLEDLFLNELDRAYQYVAEHTEDFTYLERQFQQSKLQQLLRNLGH